MSDSPESLQEIDISVAEQYQQELSEDWLRTVMEAALVEALPQSEPTQVGLMITDDETVQGLNRQFRGLDEVTDVLSFSASHSGHWEGEPQESEQSDETFVESEEPEELVELEAEEAIIDSEGQATDEMVDTANDEAEETPSEEPAAYEPVAEDPPVDEPPAEEPEKD